MVLTRRGASAGPALENDMLNLSAKALKQLNADKPTAVEVAASALVAAERLARMSPDDEQIQEGARAARAKMLALLSK